MSKKPKVREILVCEMCESENVFQEVIRSREWQGSREVQLQVTHYTCVECGHSWDE
ncbi:MAG TPA: hypothetical protein PKD55_02500 [Bellilinea sp.]|nr:hypothetical protein [Bellilinea sp.]